jgi:hypothetical protein
VRRVSAARDPTSGILRAGDRDERRTLILELDRFAWEALTEQSAELDVSVDELVRFSVLYYLADHDSQRLARRPPANLDSPRDHE